MLTEEQLLNIRRVMHEVRGLAFTPIGAPYVICSCGALVPMGTLIHRPYWIAHRDGISIDDALATERSEAGA